MRTYDLQPRQEPSNLQFIRRKYSCRQVGYGSACDPKSSAPTAKPGCQRPHALSVTHSVTVPTFTGGLTNPEAELDSRRRVKLQHMF